MSDLARGLVETNERVTADERGERRTCTRWKAKVKRIRERKRKRKGEGEYRNGGG